MKGMPNYLESLPRFRISYTILFRDGPLAYTMHTQSNYLVMTEYRDTHYGSQLNLEGLRSRQYRRGYRWSQMNSSRVLDTLGSDNY